MATGNEHPLDQRVKFTSDTYKCFDVQGTKPQVMARLVTSILTFAYVVAYLCLNIIDL